VLEVGAAWRRREITSLEALLPLIAALIGAFIGARASVRTVVDANRIKWIDTLREDVSELLILSTDVRGTNLLREQLDTKKSNRLRQMDFKIGLMLNPHEKDHVLLDSSVNKLVQMTLDSTISDSDYFDARNSVFDTCRALRKKEWDRVSKTWLRRLFRQRR
jgi:hypothetical protein